ncbi:hypothetical protein EJB05_24710 [Eragrostis curvula]|uniref:Uncharacterized protein n=1 Tax=Eragrostis curvula TaxID=38414 RepID=A0A5J9VAH4_9POAL|nr:hypothetical protein EJB05_24710 [Eragrostis curvula]
MLSLRIFCFVSVIKKTAAIQLYFSTESITIHTQIGLYFTCLLQQRTLHFAILFAAYFPV